MINKLKELRETGSEEGFTLIELMIVVVIIGILAAIAIPIFMNQQKAAIEAGMKSDVKNTVTNIATALAKAPTATVIEGTATGASAKGTIGTVTTAFDLVVSDAGTTVTVGSPDDIDLPGTWEAYAVEATSTATDVVVEYDSETGKTK